MFGGSSGIFPRFSFCSGAGGICSLRGALPVRRGKRYSLQVFFKCTCAQPPLQRPAAEAGDSVEQEDAEEEERKIEL